MKRIGIYAGSFDPPTLGHLWMIQQGASLFDELVVVLGVNPDKKGFLSEAQRMDALRGMLAGGPPHVRVEKMSGGFLVEYARRLGATHLLRGIRNTVDFEYEKSMDRMNARMEPALQTVYLMPPPELEAVSSSFVRGFVGVQGWQRWVRECVPANVFNIIASMNK
jgi:pantetheine-phosphate adenylyltransferase